MDEKIKGKRAQVTIWIVVAVILIASVLLLFIFSRQPTITTPRISEQDPISFIKKCSSDALIEAENIMISQSGLIQQKNTVFFNNSNIEYYCDNIGDYNPCINQHPMLLKEIKNQIISYIHPKIEQCFTDMKEEFERRQIQTTYDSSSNDLEVSLSDDKIGLVINRELTLNDRGEIKNFDNFNAEIKSPLYNLVVIGMEIADQEARYCYFENVGYSAIYPRYRIERFVMSDSTKIYTIKDSDSGKEISLAIRGCSLPLGLP